jgi:glucans biosynthesis protein
LGAAGFPAASLLAAAAAPSPLKFLGQAQAFDFAGLKGSARALAAKPYQAPVSQLPAAVSQLDWDQYQAINYRSDHALWGDEALRFQAKFFHLGLFFKSPVKIFELKNGQAQQLACDPEMFDYGKSGLLGSGSIFIPT